MLEIFQNQLEFGKQYYIESLSRDNDKNIIVSHKRIATFTYLECIHNHPHGAKWAYFTHFHQITENGIFDGYDVKLHEIGWRYYEVKRNKIQQNMETRVCDIMLRNITGDEYFTCGF